MKIWIIQYHHRHGVDTWPVISDGEPDLEEIENGLDDFEPEREEFLEAAGPFFVASDLPDWPLCEPLFPIFFDDWARATFDDYTDNGAGC